MRLRSNTASIIPMHFFTQITASISSDTFKHIIGVSGKRRIPAPEAVTPTVGKNNFAASPVPPQGLYKFFVGSVFLGRFFYL